MEQEKVKTLFDVRLNQEGILAIKKLSRIVKWVMILMIIASSISLIDTFFNYYLTRGKFFTGNKFVFFINRIYPVYAVIYFILAFYQTHNFFRTARCMSAAIDNSDEGLFNRSFFYLYKSSIFGVLGLLLFLLMVSFRFFVLVESYSNK